MAQTITVAPTVGQGLLFTQNGPGVTPGYNAIDLHRMIQASPARRQGVYDQTGWQVQQASGGPSTTVEVLANVGLARVDGTLSGQSVYVVAPHFQVAALTITAAHATLPRIDSVVLQVLDSDFDGSGAWRAQIALLTGTATSGATLDNRTNAPSLPASCLHLADLRVDPNDTTIDNSQIRDYRYHAGLHDPGDIKMCAGTPGPGWKAMEGLALKRAVHDRLYAAIGNVFGAGDGSTTFGNLADARSRVLIPPDNGVNLLPGSAIGNFAGEVKHTLTAAEAGVGPHGHADTLAVDSATVVGGANQLPFASGTNWQQDSGQIGIDFVTPSPVAGGGHIGNTQGSHSHPLTGAVTDSAGAAASISHNIMQPYLVGGKQYIYAASVAA